MSARLNFNEIPVFQWKGKTFTQITSNIQKNTNSSIISKYNLRLAQPLKIFRKEIASTSLNTCNPRHVSIDELNMPNGYLISHAINPIGLKETLDINLTSNTTQIPGTCSGFSSNSVCLTPAQNALNRVRSSGNIKKIYNGDKKVDVYYTSSKQYLESRNKLFSQNQYNFLKEGNPQAKPGSSTALQNLYSPGGGTFCAQITPVYYKPNNSQYAHQGAVSSSSKITRLKYNTISTNAMKTRASYGSSIANAMAYSSLDTTYTLKDKMGFPNKCTPKFNNYSDVMTKCNVHKISNEI